MEEASLRVPGCSGGNRLAVRAERHGVDKGLVSAVGDLGVPRREPDLEGMVRAPRGNLIAVGRKCRASDLIRVAVERGQQLAIRVYRPELDTLVLAGRDKPSAVGTEGQSPDG